VFVRPIATSAIYNAGKLGYGKGLWTFIDTAIVEPFPPKCTLYESYLRAGHGGENPCIDTNDVLKLLIVGDSGRQAADHPWSALRVAQSCRKDCPTAEVLLEAKAAAPHPERYQSSLSKLSTKCCAQQTGMHRMDGSNCLVPIIPMDNE
jgi:hypothetical protein